MKLIRTITWEIPSLEQLDAESTEEVVERYEDYAEDELYDRFGYYPTVETKVEK